MEWLEDRLAPATTATHLFVALPLGAEAGIQTSVGVYALDASNNWVEDYNGTVTLSSSDAADALPGPYTFDHGFHLFSLTPAVAGTDTIKATDTGNGISGQADLSVMAAPVATHFFLATPPEAATGMPIQVGVIALDDSDHLVANYTGTVTITSTTTADMLPGPLTFDHGFGHFTMTPGGSGNDTITATDGNGITGKVTIDVHAPPKVDHFFLESPLDNLAGGPIQVAVVALDSSDHFVPNYSGTVTLTSTNAADTLPGPVMFTGGYYIFTITPGDSGADTITATDTNGITGEETIHINGMPVATRFYLATPLQAVAGLPIEVGVVALDDSDHLVSNYTGTVTITSTTAADTLPGPLTFDHGFGSFAMTPGGSGADTITATDAKGLTGKVTIAVQGPAVVTHFFLRAGPSLSMPAGSPVTIAAFALDDANQWVQDYTGTATITSSGTGDTLPAPVMFDHGFARFTMTPAAAGDDVVTATDASVTPAIAGSVTLSVAAPQVATHFFIAPVLAAAGMPAPVTVVALDASDHIVENYQGTVTLSTSNPADTVPAAATFSGGYHTFTVTFAAAGADTVKATDMNGLTGSVVVNVGQMFTPPAGGL